MEVNENYPVLLLTLVSLSDTEVPQNIKLAAAINLKNLVKRNWVVVSGTGTFLTLYENIYFKMKSQFIILTKISEM